MNSNKNYYLFILLFNNVLFLGFLNVFFDKDVVSYFEEFILIISVIIVIYKYKEYDGKTKVWLVLSLFLFFSLVAQSLLNYGVPFVYPHVFAKILIAFYILAVLYFSRKNKFISVVMISKVILFFYFFDLFVLGWIKYFSPVNLQNLPAIYGGAGDSRVFHASVIYLLIIPLLSFLNKYSIEKNVKYLFLFVFILSIILLQNHRTIWVTTIFVLLVNFFLMRKRDRIQRSYSSLKMGIIFIFFISLLFFVVVIYLPNIASELFYRYEDILNFEHQGTGQWRYEQALSYLPLIIDNPLFGMRLRGFEIDSIQGFGAATGQHFHNGYLEFLFYFGIPGILLFYGLIIYVYRTFIKSRNFDIDNIVLASFVLSGFVFSFGYRLPIFYWGFLGLLWSRVDQSRK